MNVRNQTIFTLAVASLLSAGCTETRTATEADYGRSLSQVTAASDANPSARASANGNVVESKDAETLNSSINNMRKAAAKATDDTKRDIVINVGGNQGR